MTETTARTYHTMESLRQMAQTDLRNVNRKELVDMYRLVTSGTGKAISDGRLTQKQRPASERCLIWHYLGAIQRRSPMR